jgi:ATP-dependent RNA helicase DDX5/DBP2
MSETEEERSARKASKKAQKEGGDSKKRKSGDDDEVPKSKKRKADEEADLLPRRRTRSMSDAEEVYPPGVTPEDFRKSHQITIVGHAPSGSGQYDCPAPMLAFNDTPFDPTIRKALDAAGFPNPTPTQSQAWPIALSGRDVITVARTGSG